MLAGFPPVPPYLRHILITCPSSNRACDFPAHGFPTAFLSFHRLSELKNIIS
uniref:Uncharacterized protein n=1 Tax=Kuenenia stuttgartiensis TaxID=174633 RepID=Q1Q7C8_KUEST|nr:unknown protein [Candidatus Kuenenia stuttgartiensis]